MANKTVPLTVTLSDGSKKQIGVAEVAEDGTTFEAKITDREWVGKFGAGVRHFSIGNTNETVDNLVIHNIFEDQKKGK